MRWLKRLLGVDAAKPDQNETPAAPAPSAKPEAAASVDFPFSLVTVHGAEAVAAWRKYLREWRKERCSPVVLGSAEDVKMRAELLAEDPSSVAEMLQRAAPKSAAEFFQQRQAEYAEYNSDLQAGPWPTRKVPPSPLTAHTDILTGRAKPLVYIAKVPTPHAWEVPAHLKAGGWNDCPFPESQVAVLKYWHEKYGIEVYSLTGDVLECVVSRPPTTQADALALAREQFLFCSDIVHQGTETIEILAATLLNAEVWYFWWD